MRAIASFTSVRRRSMRARDVASYFPAVASSPNRISGVRSSAQSGHLSASCAAIEIIPEIDQAPPIRGTWVSRSSTRCIPRSPISAPAASSSSSHMIGDTTAPPQSSTTATRAPRSASRCVPRPFSQPSTRGRLSGSRASCPLVTSNQRAVSRTDLAITPVDTVRLPYSACGPRGIRPNVPFRPTRPVKPAGMRIDPPPSPPVAIG